MYGGQGSQDSLHRRRFFLSDRHKIQFRRIARPPHTDEESPTLPSAYLLYVREILVTVANRMGSLGSYEDHCTSDIGSVDKTQERVPRPVPAADRPDINLWLRGITPPEVSYTVLALDLATVNGEWLS
jgi:hypothetical protein